MAHNMENIRWVPALPQGWEAKYDPTQKRYFFIDHATKKTTWEDPRFGRRAPQAPQAPQATQAYQHNQTYGHGQVPAAGYAQNYGYYHQAQQQQQQHPPPPHQQQAEAIPMKTMAQQYVSGHATQYPQQGRLWQPGQAQAADEEDESSFMEDLPEFEVDEVLVKQFQAAYPTCPADRIRRALERNCNARRATELELELYGYDKATTPRRGLSPTRQTGQASTSNEEAVVQKLKREFGRADIQMIRDLLNEVNNSEQRAREGLKNMGYGRGSSEAVTNGLTSNAAKSTSGGSKQSTPKRVTSPVKPSMNDAHKDSLVTKLAQDHPALDRTIVQLALETADNNPAKAREMLRFMYADNTSTSPRTTSPTRHTTAAGASSPARDLAGSSATSDAGYDEISQDYYLYDNYARPGSASSMGREGSPKPKGDYQRPKSKKEGRRSKHVAKINVGSPISEVVVSQRQVISSRRTQAKGANPDLSGGADISRVATSTSPLPYKNNRN